MTKYVNKVFLFPATNINFSGEKMSLISFGLYLVVAAVLAIVSEKIAPDTVPGGFITSIVVGFIGGWLAVNLAGNIGPQLAQVTLLPCILGSAIFVFVILLVSQFIKTRKS